MADIIDISYVWNHEEIQSTKSDLQEIESQVVSYKKSVTKLAKQNDKIRNLIKKFYDFDLSEEEKRVVEFWKRSYASNMADIYHTHGRVLSILKKVKADEDFLAIMTEQKNVSDEQLTQLYKIENRIFGDFFDRILANIQDCFEDNKKSVENLEGNVTRELEHKQKGEKISNKLQRGNLTIVK